MRVGIVGFGRLAQTLYVAALKEINDVTVVAVADPSASARAAAGRAFPYAARYESHEEMAARTPVDAVLVASPPWTHLPVWRAVRELGVPVLMEKPVCLPGELEAFVGDPAARLLQIDLNRRRWPVYQRLGRLLRSGAAGGALEVELDWAARVSGYFEGRPSAGRDGGVLYDLGSQQVDLVTSTLLGSLPEVVSARLWSERLPDDSCSMELRFPNAVVSATACFGKRGREVTTARGPAGRWRLKNPNMRPEELDATGPRRAATRALAHASLGVRAVYRPRSMGRWTIGASLHAFVESARKGRPFTPGIEEALVNAKVLEAAWESSQTGRPVHLSWDGNSAT